ncbi:methionyl-tRNA formyltransferase [Aliidiomarina haloalkalitolerans]|nr:formyltransferase family protein [Aliidiomarina haloalkalitolerans]
MTLHDDQAINKSGRVYLDNFCLKHNIPLLKSRHVNNQDVIEAIKQHEIDWLFIIGWSQIAGSEVLNAPKQGVLGMHPTLLPKGRGRAAIPWAILKGLDKTGVTLFKLDTGVDTGPIVDQVEIPLSAKTTASELYELVDEAHIRLMKKVVPALMSNSITLTEQDDSKATEWPGRKPEDGRIDPKGNVQDAERLVRAVTRPYPGAFIDINGRRFVIWQAEVKSESTTNAGFQFEDGWLEFVEFDEMEIPSI